MLVTDGHTGESRDSLAAVRALARRGYRVSVTYSRKRSMATTSRYCSRRVEVPYGWEEGYADAIEEEASSRRYVTALPTSEVALQALGPHVPSLVNKEVLAAFARQAGVPMPPHRRFGSTAALAGEAGSIDYPVVVKPLVRNAPALRAGSPGELPRHELGPVMVQPFLSGGMHAVSGVMWEERLVAAVHERWLRLWPAPCGLASAAETTPPDPELELRLQSMLRGYTGMFHAQFAGPYLLDLNLRIHTTHPLAEAAGVNLAGIYCDLLDGRGPDRPVRGRPGLFFRWIEGDVRSILRAIRAGDMAAGAAVRCLTPRRGAAHSTESLGDPLPALVRVERMLARRVLGRSEGRAAPVPWP